MVKIGFLHDIDGYIPMTNICGNTILTRSVWSSG